MFGIDSQAAAKDSPGNSSQEVLNQGISIRLDFICTINNKQIKIFMLHVKTLWIQLKYFLEVTGLGNKHS